MDHERIDFSLLDPSRDEVRWQRSIDALVTQALAERRQRLSVERQLLRWAQPVLAVAAGLCIATWTAGYLLPAKKPVPSSQHSAAVTLANWAVNHRIPEPSDVLGVLGNNNP